jgi:hypothetical protein
MGKSLLMKKCAPTRKNNQSIILDKKIKCSVNRLPMALGMGGKDGLTENISEV